MIVDCSVENTVQSCLWLGRRSHQADGTFFLQNMSRPVPVIVTTGRMLAKATQRAYLKLRGPDFILFTDAVRSAKLKDGTR